MRAKKTMFETTVDECVGDEGNDDSLLLALGYELTTDILVRLPVKSLFRLKCASKRWFRLISDPFFGRVYTKSNPAAMKLITTATGFYQQFTFDPSENKSRLDEQIYFYPFIRTAAIANGAELEDNCDNVVGHSHTLSFLGLKRTILLSSSKGLLLCSDSSSKYEKMRYFVCNPITKQWVTLPEPLDRGRCLHVSPHLHCYNDEYDNLGEEGVPNKFVVVLFMLDLFAPYNMLRSVETFSSETGRWRVSSDSIPDPTSRFVSIHACWGIFDWMAYWVNTDGKIVAYDLKKETLEFLPRAPGSQHMDLGCFGAFSLSSNGSRLHYAESDDANLRIWVLLSDESGRTSEWSLKHTVSLQCLVDDNPRVIKRAANYRNPYPYMLGGHKLLFLPLAFHPYDPNVVVLHIPGLVVSCNVDTRNLELIFSYRGVKRLKQLNWSQVFPYTPTLWPVAIPHIMIETAASTSVNISSTPMPVKSQVNILSAPIPVEPQIEAPNAHVPVVPETEQRGDHLPVSTVDLSSEQRERDHLKISGSMLTPIGMREEDEGEKAGEEDEQYFEATHSDRASSEWGGEDSAAGSDASSMKTGFDTTEMDAANVYLKDLWSHSNKIREEDRAILDLIFENHPETFTSRSVRNIEDISVANLKIFASYIRRFTSTPPSEITTPRVRTFLAAIKDLEDCYHFKLDWLDSAARNLIHPTMKRLIKAQTSENAQAEQRQARADALRDQIKSLELELSKVLSGGDESVARISKIEEDVKREVGASWEGFYRRENLLFIVTGD